MYPHHLPLHPHLHRGNCYFLQRKYLYLDISNQPSNWFRPWHRGLHKEYVRLSQEHHQRRKSQHAKQLNLRWSHAGIETPSLSWNQTQTRVKTIVKLI